MQRDPSANFFSRNGAARFLQYTPGETLLPCQLRPPGSKTPIERPQFIYVPIVGPQGAGKSSLAQTFEHCVRGVPTSALQRSPHRGATSVGSFTTEAELVPLSNNIILIDTVGLQQSDDLQTKFDTYQSEVTYYEWLKSYVRSSSFTLAEYHCPIFVWSARNLATVGSLRAPCKIFQTETGCQPVIVITHADDQAALRKFGQTEDEQICAVQNAIGYGQIYFIETYAKGQAEKDAVNQKAFEILTQVMWISDQLLFKRRIGKLVMRSGKKQ